jgi:hypothetical protein
MVGKRAKILSANNVEDLLVFARQTRHPIRNAVLVLLSVKAGLRAAEIGKLTWPMVVDPSGEIGCSLELHDRGQKRQRSSHSNSPRVTRRPSITTQRGAHSATLRRPPALGRLRLG